MAKREKVGGTDLERLRELAADRCWGEAEGRAAVAAFEASGLSMEAFARATGIKGQRLAWWRRRAAVPEPAGRIEFVPVDLARPVPGTAAVGEDPEARLARRKASAPPILAALGKWIADTYNDEPPKSPLARACHYAINRWTSLQRFLEDGRLPLDNTASERALRQVAVGRKNYLFAGPDQGGERAAIAYTVIGTCMLAGIDPLAYLTDVFRKIAEGWKNKRFEELLPPNWAAARSTRDAP